MRLTIQKKIGTNTYSFSFEGKDLWEVLVESQKISFHDLSACGLCESNRLALFAYETKEKKFKYIKVSCKACNAGLTLGKSTTGDAYYFRKNEDTKALDWQRAEKE